LPRRRPRRRPHWVAYLWPGLPHLWVRGSIAGLTLALAFSVVLNVLVLATVVWPAWLETRLKFGCAAAAFALWVAALWETRGELRRLAAERESEQANEPPEEIQNRDEPLRSALGSYLRGDWVDAERTLRRVIRRDRDDFEARLWLVAVLRRAGRVRSAERLLRRVERRDAAAGWRTEVDDERRRLEELLETDEPAKTLPIRHAAPPAPRPARRDAA